MASGANKVLRQYIRALATAEKSQLNTCRSSYAQIDVTFIRCYCYRCQRVSANENRVSLFSSKLEVI